MGKIAQATLLLSLALFLGRISGFFREIVLASKTGVSASADAAILVLTLPDFLVGLLLAGGFSAALVPALRRMGPQDRRQLYLDVSLRVGLLFSALGLGVFLMPGLVPAVFAPGMAPETVAPYLDTFSIVALSLPFAALTGVAAAFLNANEKFFIAGLGTLIFNATVIAALVLYFDPETAFWTLGLAVVSATCLRWAIQLPFTRSVSQGTAIFRPKRVTRGLAVQFGAGVFASGMLVMAPVVFRTILSVQADGLLAAFNFAQKLFELPIALLFVPVMTVLMPRFTDVYSEDQTNHRLFLHGATALLVLSGATLFVGQVFGEPMARLIYLRGAFDEAALAPVVAIGKMLFWALPPAAIAILAAAALNAQARTFTVLANTSLALAVGVVFAALLPSAAPFGLLVFYGLVALLHLKALRVAFGALVCRFANQRAVATVCLLVVVALVELFLPTGLPDAVRVLQGSVVWLLLVAVWVPMVRRPWQRAGGRMT